MSQATADRMQAELNALIDLFEARRSSDATCDLRACLPSARHPLYREGRRELIRIDLEFGWREGRPRRLDDYLQMFPDLAADRIGIQQIAFEEYRLRVQAGEKPSAAEYERRYGVTTDDWPGSDVDLSEISKTIVVRSGEAVRDPVTDTTTAPIHTPPFEWDLFEDRLQAALNATDRPLAPEQTPPRVRGEIAQALLTESTSHSRDEASFLLAQVLTALPEVGTRFLKFHLIAELGRGGFGRVYLAHQGDLANRLVALKITVDRHGEEEKLAQLQHTNVVPIYSVHKAGALHAVCMPYFGPTTLTDVIKKLGLAGEVPKSGASLVETLRARGAEFRAVVDKATHGKVHLAPADNASASGGKLPPTLKMLGAADYVQAVLWLMERITEGLEHAHERGILHGDLKPANILLTDEAQPMLLDFNLATDIKVRPGIGELRVGGTLPYMAPEHLAALDGGDRKLVDARSDLYSLGVIFCELLTGRLPFETPRGRLAELLPNLIAQRRKAPPFLRRHNRAISPAVEAIVRKCLEPDPSMRYQAAKDLHEDLQLHRQHYPLRHVSEPSLRERARKWMRRHPRLTSPASIGTIAVMLLMLICGPLGWQRWELYQEERQKLAADVNIAQQQTETAEKEREAAQKSAAKEKKEREVAQKKTADAQRELFRNDALNTAREFHAAAAPLARGIIDRINLARMRPETWAMEHKDLDAASATARQMLDHYRVLDNAAWNAQPSVMELPAAERNQLRKDVAAILYSLAQVEQIRAERLREHWGNDTSAFAMLIGGKLSFCAVSIPGVLVQARLLAASTYNLQARRCCAADAVPRAFVIQQAELTRLMGDTTTSTQLLAAGDRHDLCDGTDDWYWTASALAARGDFEQAKKLLAEATRRTPDHFGIWHLLALCHQSAGEFREAEACFSTCAALRTEASWIHYHRGLARLRLGKWPEAEGDFDVFIKKYPRFRAAYVQRAAALEGKGRKNYPKVVADLTQAIRLAADAPELYYLRAQFNEKSGDKKAAQADRRTLRDNTPWDMAGWFYRGMVRVSDDPKGALADFDQALAFDADNVAVLYQKALLLADRLDRPGEAIGALNRIVVVNKRHAEARIKRGLVYASMRGGRDKAVDDAEIAIRADPSPPVYYQAACIYALASREKPGDAKRAVALLAHALRNGFGAKLFQKEADLQPLHGHPDYRRLEANADLLDPARPPRVLTSLDLPGTAKPVE